MIGLLRLIWALLTCQRPARAGLFDSVRPHFRVLPWDLDANLHLNNALYLKYMDFARLEHARQTGLLGAFLKHRISSLVANNEISYVRSLQPFQHFEIATRLLGWDERYLYVEQVFIADGETCAVANSRLAQLQHGKRLRTTEALAQMGITTSTPALPATIHAWNHMLAEKRRSALGPNTVTPPVSEVS